ncbi:MAG: glycosyltransferase [Acidimicrobiales bacterium]
MIGYYVHHHGSGHARRASTVRRELGAEVIGLGSGGRPSGWADGGWIDLADDADDKADALAATRSGSWHWAPPSHPGFGQRMRTIASWIDSVRPELLVVDVSVEVTALAVLLGVPVATVLLHGERTDPPHRLALDSADAVLGAWPASHRLPWHDRLGLRLTTTGGFGRFDGRAPTGAARARRVVVMAGTGGSDLFRRGLTAAVAATPAWEWHVLGATGSVPGASEHGWVEDPWPWLCSAEVVVTACGDAALSEVAAARRPAVLVPQCRPFDEQRHAASALARTGAPVVEADPASTGVGWNDLLGTASQMDGAAWADQYDGLGAQRFATALRQVAGLETVLR